MAQIDSTVLQRNIRRRLLLDSKPNGKSLWPAPRDQSPNATRSAAKTTPSFLDKSNDYALGSCQTRLLRITIGRLVNGPGQSVLPTTSHKKRCLLRHRCQIQLMIRHRHDGPNSLDSVLFCDSRDALIQFYEITDALYGVIELEKPFDVDAQALFIADTQGSYWKHNLATVYALSLRLRFLESAHLQEFLPLVFGQEKSATDPSYAVFDADYSTSFDVAAETSMLWYKSRFETRRTRFHLGLEMQWYTSTKSALEIYNQSSGIRAPTREIDVEFVFEGTQTSIWQADGLKCPLCDQRDHSSIDALESHLHANHRQLSFQRRKAEKNGHLAVQFVVACIRPGKINAQDIATPPDSVHGSPGKLSRGSSAWLQNGKWLSSSELRIQAPAKSTHKVAMRTNGGRYAPAFTNVKSVLNESPRRTYRDGNTANSSDVQAHLTATNPRMSSTVLKSSIRKGGARERDPDDMSRNGPIKAEDYSASPRSALSETSDHLQASTPPTTNGHSKSNSTTSSGRDVSQRPELEEHLPNGTSKAALGTRPNGPSASIPSTPRQQVARHAERPSATAVRDAKAAKLSKPDRATGRPISDWRPGLDQRTTEVDNGSQLPSVNGSGPPTHSGVISPSASPHSPMMPTLSSPLLHSPRLDTGHRGISSGNKKKIRHSSCTDQIRKVDSNRTGSASPITPSRLPIHSDRVRLLSDTNGMSSAKIPSARRSVHSGDEEEKPLHGDVDLLENLTRPGVDTQRSKKSGAPQAGVQELTRFARPKHPVPPAPEGVTLFRSNTKRPLAEGEFVSESEDEIDDTWLRLRHEEMIDDNAEATSKEKEFMKRWDAHFTTLQLNGNKYAANALQRFTAMNREWLRSKKDMQSEFYLKLAAWHVDNLIAWPVIVSCINMLKRGGLRDDHSRREKHGIMPDTKASLQGSMPWAAVCSCGNAASVADMDGTVSCANTTCKNPDYHMACAGLAARPPIWYCTHCPRPDS